MNAIETSEERKDLTILAFCITKLLEIIDSLRGLTPFKSGKGFQALGRQYSRIHTEMLRISKRIQPKDPNTVRLLHSLTESRLKSNGTFAFYKGYVDFDILDGMLEVELDPLLDSLRYAIAMNDLRFPELPRCYVFLEEAIHEVSIGTDEPAKIKRAARSIDINTIVRNLINDFRNEVTLQHKESIGQNAPARIEFETDSGVVFFNEIELGRIKPKTQPFFFFRILYENMGKYVLIDKIVDGIPSIDHKRSFPEGKAGFCSTIKGKLPISVRDYIHSCKGGYMLCSKKRRRPKPVRKNRERI